MIIKIFSNINMYFFKTNNNTSINNIYFNNELNKNIGIQLLNQEIIKKRQQKNKKHIKQKIEEKISNNVLETCQNKNTILNTQHLENLNTQLETKKIYKTVYIISNVDGGGSTKYLNDIIDQYKNTKIVRIRDKKSILEVSHFYPYDILFVQQLLWTDISPQFLINMKIKFNVKIVISVHDFCWFINNDNVNKPSKNVWEIGYLLNLKNIDPYILALFYYASMVIHPSKFTFDHYSNFFPKYNSILQQHNDIKIDYTSKFIPKINKNVINIGNFQGFSEYKGSENVKILSEKYNYYKGYKINFLIVGKNIPEYNESNWHNEMSKHNFHCLLHLNKFGETYSYCLTKSINSGLPILYNNIGSFKERIPKNNEHYKIVINNENEYNNSELLFKKFEEMLDYIIINNGLFDKTNMETKIIYKDLYNYLFETNNVVLNIKSFKQNNNYNKHNNIVIILTSTVFVNKNKFCVYQTDTNDRLNTYIRSILKWLTYTNFNIIVVDNSGYQYKELYEYTSLFEKNRLEICSFKENELKSAQYLINNDSKGASELFAIQYAYHNSKLVKTLNPSFIIKITCRYFIPVLEEFLDNYKLEKYDCIVQNDDNRCEMVGCNANIFNHIFNKNLLDKNNSYIGHVEDIFKYRISLYNNVIHCKSFFIEKTQRGGLAEFFHDI